MMKKLTLNCDLGESFGPWRLGNDAAIMPFIDQANIACGFHAGDPSVMRETLLLARDHTVEIGAHVAYPDLQGFGRRSMHLRGQALIDFIHYQIATLDGMSRVYGLKTDYVKPHGALYNDMAKDDALCADVMRAVASWHTPLALVVMAKLDDSIAVAQAAQHRLTLRFEAFADRSYSDTGALTPREQPGALLTLDQALVQAQAIAAGGCVSTGGRQLTLTADTLCVHGDTPNAPEMARALRTALTNCGG